VVDHAEPLESRDFSNLLVARSRYSRPFEIEVFQGGNFLQMCHTGIGDAGSLELNDSQARMSGKFRQSRVGHTPNFRAIHLADGRQLFELLKIGVTASP